MKIFNQLTRTEMKNVTGGVQQGGGNSYNCTIYYANGTTMTGVSGGSSLNQAESNLTANIENHPSVYGNPSYWSCDDNA